MPKPTLHVDVERTHYSKYKKRSPSAVLVGPATEWTDHIGLLLIFGLRRSTAYHLVETEPELKTASISLKGANERRGKRLFSVPQFRRFLESKQLPREVKNEIPPS
jgi:hypothetical protein